MPRESSAPFAGPASSGAAVADRTRSPLTGAPPRGGLLTIPTIAVKGVVDQANNRGRGVRAAPPAEGPERAHDARGRSVRSAAILGAASSALRRRASSP